MKDFFIDNQIQVYIKEPSLTLLNDDGTINNGTEIAWSVFATMVKQDTKELFAKFERGREWNRQQGKFNGGAFGALYGYMVDDGGYIVPCPQEIEVLHEVFTMYASGKYSIRSLTKELQQRGLYMRGRKFTENNLARVLSNTSYLGYNEKTKRKYTPIISKELWEKVEQVRKQNDLAIRKTKESQNINLAIKLLKCSECGHNYVATRDKYTCYKHVMKQRFTEDCENSVSISIEIMDMLLWKVAFIEHMDFLERNSETEIKKLNVKKMELNEKISQSEKNIKNLLPSVERAKDLYISGDLSKESYDKRKAQIMEKENTYKGEIKTYKKEIQAIESMIKDLQEFDLEHLMSLAMGVDRADKKEMKEIINQHVRDCYVKRISLNERKAIEIQINCYEGIIYKYVYFYTIKEKTRQLYILKNDGTLIPFFSKESQAQEYIHYMRDKK